jgi:hypothetical protein
MPLCGHLVDWLQIEAAEKPGVGVADRTVRDGANQCFLKRLFTVFS